MCVLGSPDLLTTPLNTRVKLSMLILPKMKGFRKQLLSFL